MHNSVTLGEQRKAAALVQTLLHHGWTISINNGGEEDEITDSRNQASILDAMGESDSESLTCKRAGKTAGILLVYGNSPDGDELIADYNTSLESVIGHL